MAAITDVTLETQRGYEEHLKDRPTPDAQAFRTAVIEAEAIGMKALGKDYRKYTQALARKTSNTYRGQIVGENDHFIIQKVSPLNTIRHLKRDLPRIPHVGQEVRIGYCAGACNICDDVKLSRKRTYRIAL
jgi:hypothetical protein